MFVYYLDKLSMSVGSYPVVSRAELLLLLCFLSMIDVAYETTVGELE